MEQHTRIQYLLDRLATRTATADELDELSVLVDADDTGALVDQAENRLQAQESPVLPVYNAAHWNKVADQILAADKLQPEAVAQPGTRVHFLHRVQWAAAIVVLLGAGTWAFQHYHQPKPVAMINAVKLPDADPGRNGAVLTLADGSQVVLDSLGNGVVTSQHGTSVVLKQSTLQYVPGANTSGEMEYNSITTPKGRQFQLILPDGSKVWLNAGSSLRFPVAFSGDERAVALTGEAYFEVTKNVSKPFKVKANKELLIEVLGTSFNVNAYTNEKNTRTTLVDGAVRVFLTADPAHRVILKPNQEVQSNGDGLQQPVVANVEQATAWKSGLFNFEGMGLKEMMRQLERWYNLEVVYEGNVPDVKFFGEMSRTLKLSDVLAGLERSDVHFRLEEGHRLVVMP